MHTAQPTALAAFLPWGGSQGAGRMTRCKDNNGIVICKNKFKKIIILK